MISFIFALPRKVKIVSLKSSVRLFLWKKNANTLNIDRKILVYQTAQTNELTAIANTDAIMLS